MKRNLSQQAAGLLLAASALVLGGCAGTAPTTSAAPPAAAAQPATGVVNTLFAAMPEDGRLYYFTDHKLYLTFLGTDEVALRQTRIGAGPEGKTVVFGLTNDDVKAKQPSLAEKLFDGAVKANEKDFYGEVFKDGRYYVFGSHHDMHEFIKSGEVPYSVTDIGAGPKGETLVWVLNKNTIKGGRPASHVARFKALHSMK